MYIVECCSRDRGTDRTLELGWSFDKVHGKRAMIVMRTVKCIYMPTSCICEMVACAPSPLPPPHPLHLPYHHHGESEMLRHWSTSWTPKSRVAPGTCCPSTKVGAPVHTFGATEG